MFNFIRKLFNKKEVETKCITCKHKSGDKSGWFCKQSSCRETKKFTYHRPICGKQKIKTSPPWCVLRKKV